jgi:prepilin-type N-terminal cleavage/methylation domain-containing protein
VRPSFGRMRARRPRTATPDKVRLLRQVGRFVRAGAPYGVPAHPRPQSQPGGAGRKSVAIEAAGRTEGAEEMRLVLPREGGYSLIEVTVAVIVFSIAIVFVYQMLFSGQTTVEFEGERRVALRRAELKLEELKYAGYGSEGSDVDYTSVNMEEGTHPDDPTVVLDDRGTAEPGDDLVGSMTWTVKETTYIDAGVFVDGKIVDLTIVWPLEWERDDVRLVTLMGE